MHNNKINKIFLRDIHDGLLEYISNPPKLLYYRGNVRLLTHPGLRCAVIGSRKATTYGLAVTKQLVAPLAQRGAVIVSGLARGIDTAAHTACLDVGGSTIAVIGSGLDPDVLYPQSNHALAERIVAEGGLLLSEYPSDMQAQPWSFPKRNRIVSGLAQATIVIEAGEKSGTSITANQALEQGRDVFAVPGNITHPTSRGTNRLIAQGAYLIESAETILTHYADLLNDPPEEKKIATPVSPEQQKIIHNLTDGARSLDWIIRGTGLTPAIASSMLTQLELNGHVTRLPDGTFSLTHS